MGDPAYQPVDAPPVHVVEVRATTSLDANNQPVRTVLDPTGAVPVLSTASFVLKFDRFLLPSSATRQSVCVSADVATQVRKIEDCVNPVFLEPTYNPVRREVIYRQKQGEARLIPGTRYALTVLRPEDERVDVGIRAFDGAPLRENVRFEFVVATQDPPGATVEWPPTGDLWCTGGAAKAVATCAYGAACHMEKIAAEGLNLFLGPTLNTIDYIQSTAISRTAHQTQMGEHADEPDVSPARFGRAMPIIDPERPGNSYLLYKIIIGQGVVEPSATAEQAQHYKEEIDRLNAAFVVGLPMPPPNTPLSFKLLAADPNDPLLVPHVDGMDVVTAWIADGAKLRDCTTPPPQ